MMTISKDSVKLETKILEALALTVVTKKARSRAEM